MNIYKGAFNRDLSLFRMNITYNMQLLYYILFFPIGQLPYKTNFSPPVLVLLGNTAVFVRRTHLCISPLTKKHIDTP